MPTPVALTQALRTLEDTISSARRQLGEILRIEPSHQEKVDVDWAIVVPALRQFLHAATPHTQMLHYGVSRDHAEVSVKLRNPTAKNGASYLILSRKHPSDQQAPLDKVWLYEPGGEPIPFAEVVDAARSLVKRVIAAAA